MTQAIGYLFLLMLPTIAAVGLVDELRRERRRRRARGRR